MTISEVLHRLARDWDEPRLAEGEADGPTFKLVCRITAPEGSMINPQLPPQLRELWHAVGTSELFADREYGQWGLQLLGPADSSRATFRYRTERHNDAREGDVVIGVFLGDQEQLILRCDASAFDFGHVLVALPLDTRAAWYQAANDLRSFLSEYERAQGRKFWEEL